MRMLLSTYVPRNGAMPEHCVVPIAAAIPTGGGQ